MPVESGKRLIQQKQLRVADQNARQSYTLLLTAGELAWFVLLQTFQLHQPEHITEAAFLLTAVFHPAQAAENVLPHRHVGEERIVLEEISDPTPLRWKIDSASGVKQNPAIQLDMAAVRALNTGDAFEGHALAAARGAQQTSDAVFCGKLHIQPENAQILFDIDVQTHRTTAFFCLDSSMFTVSRTTVLMARLTSTQNSAPASSLVRQS